MAVVQRCGEFDNVSQPGLMILCCPGILQAVDGYVNLRKTVFRCRCETKTKDNVFVEVVVAVQVQVDGADGTDRQKLVENVKAAHYKLTDPEKQLTTYVNDVVRAVVPMKNVDEVFESTDFLSKSVVHSLNNDVDAFKSMLESEKQRWAVVQQEWAKLLQRAEPTPDKLAADPHLSNLFLFRKAIYDLEKEQESLLQKQRANAIPPNDLRAMFKSLAFKFGEKKREMQAAQDQCDELLAGPTQTTTADMVFEGEQGGTHQLIKNIATLKDLNTMLKILIEKLDLPDEIARLKARIDNSDTAHSIGKFGFRILEALIVDINVDRKVADSMNQINANRRLRQAAAYQAEARKYTQVAIAEAESTAKGLQGQGTAKQRQAIVDGWKHSITDFTEIAKAGESISPGDVMEMLLLSQYFDTMEGFAKNRRSHVYFIPMELRH